MAATGRSFCFAEQPNLYVIALRALISTTHTSETQFCLPPPPKHNSHAPPHHQLHKGKYVRDHSRLEVQPTGRFFLNTMLSECVWVGPRDRMMSRNKQLRSGRLSRPELCSSGLHSK